MGQWAGELGLSVLIVEVNTLLIRVNTPLMVSLSNHPASFDKLRMSGKRNRRVQQGWFDKLTMSG